MATREIASATKTRGRTRTERTRADAGLTADRICCEKGKETPLGVKYEAHKNLPRTLPCKQHVTSPVSTPALNVSIQTNTKICEDLLDATWPTPLHARHVGGQGCARHYIRQGGPGGAPDSGERGRRRVTDRPRPPSTPHLQN